MNLSDILNKEHFDLIKFHFLFKMFWLVWKFSTSQSLSIFYRKLLENFSTDENFPNKENFCNMEDILEWGGNILRPL